MENSKTTVAELDISTQIRKFTHRPLSLPGKPLPPSIPLVVCGDYQWNANKLTLEAREERSSRNDMLHLIPQALELLNTIPKPIAVLSICGPYRTGKSYFLSRLLGSSEIFKLGHTFDACTRGIWMSTTALECDDFVLVLLDTEGMDALGASETTVTNLLITNVLLSSYLIYNSQTVPEWSDLEDMSCFSQLSSSILAQDGAEMEELSHFFPNLLWLVRDQTLKLTTDDGTPLSPTTYLKRNVLVRSDNVNPTSNDYVVNAILTLFPSIECEMLPRPSTDTTVLSRIMEQEDQLAKEFVPRFQEVKELIFQKIRPKNALDDRSLSGPLLAELAVQYVVAINSGKCLNLESSYLTAAEIELNKISQRLVEEYTQEMEEALSDKMPLEEYSDDSDKKAEHTLMSIHYAIVSQKCQALNDKVSKLLPLEVPDVAVKKFIDANVGEIIEKFKKDIVVLDDCESQDGKPKMAEIRGGALFRFVIANRKASFEMCQSVMEQKYQHVQEKLLIALANKTDVDIKDEWSQVEKEYLTDSVGPAKHEILAQKWQMLEQEVKTLKQIPGPPKGVQIVGIGRDCIKLVWDGVIYNEDAVDHYKVEVQTDTLDWKSLRDKFQRKFAVVEALESNTRYWFRVRAVSKPPENEPEGMLGNPSEFVSCCTNVSALTRGASALGGFVVGGLASPLVATVAAPYLGPVATVGGLFGAPVSGGLLAYHWYKDNRPRQGDLEPSVSSTEQ